MRLVLFDIDGTLITDGGAAREAYAHALESIYGFRGDLKRYDFSGRTDPQITHMVLGDAGVRAADIDSKMTAMWQVYLASLAVSASSRVRELPGVRALLDRLASDRRVLLGLLTGNIEPGARIKLGGAFTGRDVVIIGDSIYDVRCGVPHDATTIAIASGKTPAEKLRAEKPHHFFESAEDLEELVGAILGG